MWAGFLGLVYSVIVRYLPQKVNWKFYLEISCGNFAGLILPDAGLDLI